MSISIRLVSAPSPSVATANPALPEIIPKFTCLLNRGQPVVLHGDGSPTRRYLFAGDAADAFDTILHKGQLGHIYNVGSYDEISNFDLSGKLLAEIGIPHGTPEEFKKWVKYTHDRPFNDHRYAVDGTKLRQLGWDQRPALPKVCASPLTGTVALASSGGVISPRS